MGKFKIIKVLTPTIAGVSTYFLIRKLFSEKAKVIDKKCKDLIRGGEYEVLKNLLDNRALKIALVASFTSAGLAYFSDEVIQFLISDAYRKLCFKDNVLLYDPICQMIHEYELDMHTSHINKLILDKELNFDAKVKLLSIKLD